MTVTPAAAFTTETIDTRPAREDCAIYTAEVLANTSLSANLRRITLYCPSFTSLHLTGPDEFFGLFMPQPGQEYIPLPTFEGGNIRAHASAIPEQLRPHLRWYTVRHFDQKAGTLEFDVATHGVTPVKLASSDDRIGPGLRWALTATPGSTVGLFTAHGLWQNNHSRQLLIGDATAAPSIWSIVEFQEALHPGGLGDMHVVITAENTEDTEPGRAGASDHDWADSLGSYHVVSVPQEQQAGAVDELLRSARAEAAPLSAVDYVWVCGEQALAKGVRNQVVKDWGVDPKDVFFCPYWIAGRPRL